MARGVSRNRANDDEARNPEHTLPDLLRSGLDIVFIGINPSIYSVAQGHYFARRTNRFWPCFSCSRLGRAISAAMGVAQLEPLHDRALLEHGIGFTDLVKRATSNASALTPSELVAGVDGLLTKLQDCQPRIACFHGITGYRSVHRHLAPGGPDPALGLQSPRIGRTCLFVVPNPSPANAHFTPADQTGWYDRLDVCLSGVATA
jgi:TDG/mug DNA glycosylase family protein